MKYRLRRAPAARSDVLEVFLHIGADNPDAAERVFTAIEQSERALAANPGIGRRWEPSDPRMEGLRVYPVSPYRNYLILYRVVSREVHIYRVVHGSRAPQKIVDDIDLTTDD
jgi:toxin ParE1/3/4